MDLLAQFGIDIKLFVWQIINFAVLFVVIYKLLYRPLIAILEKRTETIEKSLEEARKIEERSKASQEEYASIIANAKREAATIIEEARTLAEKQREESLDRAKQDIANVVSQAKLQLQQERGIMLKEAKDRFAELVVKTTRVILQDISDREIDHELVKRAVEKL